jgi:hypothetical protein
MTPKGKAKEIVSKFEETLFGYDVFDDDWVKCINCALVAVDEITEQYEFDVASDVENKRFMAKLNYWDEVKKEIEKL